MIKLGGVADDGQNLQRAKYVISAVNNSTITLDESELIPINWEGRLVTQPSVSVNELGKQLLKAAADGNVDKVKQLLTKGAPFTADWLGTSPLHLAAQNNHLEMTEILLRAGISKDARTKVDRTPLHMASYEGHLDIVDTLIKHGSDINCRDLLDMTPLHWAVQNGHYDIVNYLINNGAAMDQKSKFDVTPLMIAEQTGRSDIVQLLVERMNDSAIATQNLLLHLDSENTQDSNQNQCFDDDMELEAMENQELEEYTVVREPIIIKNEFQYTDQEISHNGEVLEEEIERESEQLVQSVTVDSASLTNSLKILQQHGITMLENEENDDGNILNSVMESGHSVVLTDVGKEVLNSVKQSEQKKNVVHIDKKFVSVTPEQFLAMTNNGNNKTLKQIKMLSTRPNLKRVVMKKNKIIPISVATICDDSNSSSIKNKSQNDLELITNQLIEARKTIEEYKIKLKKKEQEAERYKMQLKLFMNPS